MGFLIGSSCFLHSPPLYHPLSFSSSSSSSQSLILYTRNARTRRKFSSPMACKRQEDPNNGVFLQRRTIMLVGISVLPFLKLSARALEGLDTKEGELKTPEENQKGGEPKGDAPSNPFLSLLNGLGIFSSGMLGALYANALKEKASISATLENMKTKLKAREVAISSLERNFELKLLNEQEDRTKQLKVAKEEQQSLVNQLSNANSTIAGLGQELLRKKKLIEDLKIQIDSLQTDLTKAEEDKNAFEEKLKTNLDFIEVLQERINLLNLELKDKEDNVQNLISSLLEKELELKDLSSTYMKTKDEVSAAHSDIKKLHGEVLENKKELELTNSLVDDLNGRVSSLTVERDDFKLKLDATQNEYKDLKLSSEEKTALDAKLLEERERNLQQLEEKLELALKEASKSQAIVADLTQERDALRETLDIELSNVKNLNHELQVTQKVLGQWRNGASDLEKQLEESRKNCTELEAEVSRVQANFVEARESLQRSLDEAKLSGEVLASELASTKELLKKSMDELQFVSQELAAVAENRDSLQKELVDIYKKAEITSHDLKEEKRVVSSLKKELQSLEKQILNDKEERKSLETDLEEATKSLDEMNQNALTLSSNLEKANSHIYSLEGEKEELYNSLAEKTNAAKAAQENMEDAHNLVMRLGKERDSLEKKSKKLEEQMASAKGEILRLRSQIHSFKAPVSDKHLLKNEAEGSVTVTARKNVRRRKSGSQSDRETTKD